MYSYLLGMLLTSQVVFADNTLPTAVEPQQTSLSQFLRNQITNPSELLTDSILIATFDVSLGDVTRSLGKNPNAKLILRDISKIPGIIANVVAGNEVGGTGYFYDVSHLWGHSFKIATKLTFYLFLKNNWHLTPATSAILANIPGDTIGRFGLVAGQARQDQKSTVPYHRFFWENFDPKWVSSTLLQQLPNLPSMHVLGSLAGAYAVGDKIQTLVLAVISLLLPHDIVVGKIFSENAQAATSCIGKARIFLMMTVAFAAEKAVFNFVFPPISRIMMAAGASLGAMLPSLRPMSPQLAEEL